MPREIMLEWKDANSWEHRAYWGQNTSNNLGTDGHSLSTPVARPGTLRAKRRRTHHHGQRHQREIRFGLKTYYLAERSLVSSMTNHGNKASPRSSTGVLSFLLVPGAPTRGEDSITKVRLPVGSFSARFDLPLIDETDYQSYQVTLQQDDDAKVLRRWPGLRSHVGPSGRLVRLTLPSRMLKVDQQYRLVLVGVSSDATTHQIAYYYLKTVN